MSYSVGRSIVEFCAEKGIVPGSSRILIVGAHGGRDFHWLTGFGYKVDVLDLGPHEWSSTNFVGDASRAETWNKIEQQYELVIMHDVLEHLPEDFAALRNARSVLKSDGFLFLSVPFKHDPEITHVRSYSEVTLNRLIGLAGYSSVWKKDRPGLLEAFPRIVNLFNYGLAMMFPSPHQGARFLRRLLAAEYSFNDKTRGLYRYLGRSTQKGVTLAATSIAGEVPNYIALNRKMFISEPGG